MNSIIKKIFPAKLNNSVNIKKANLLFVSLYFIFPALCNHYTESGESAIKVQLNNEKPVKVVKTGLDVVVASKFAFFKGMKIGIICNHTSRDKNGRFIVDLFNESGKCRVTAIFSPEHGYRGLHADGMKIGNDVDSKTGAKIYSLYGKYRKPKKEMLKNVDILVYDIQDVGARFYTYISTMSNAMESAAENGIPFVVLDRPNPIRGDMIEGSLLELKYKSFVGMHPIPIRYGLTAGELARLICGEDYITNAANLDLHIIKMENWTRDLWYDETGLPWISPSPNMTSLKTAIVYPGFCLLEGTNLSEGRGTDSPFLKFGAPWIDSQAFARELNSLDIQGAIFEPSTFTPISIPNVAYKPKYENKQCSGVKIEITDRNDFKPVNAIVRILKKAKQMYPKEFKWHGTWIDNLYGSDKLRKVIENNEPLDELFKSWEKDLQQFKEISQQYKIY